MHKKKVKNKLYYYTTVREGNKTKSVYLGKSFQEAERKEKQLHKTSFNWPSQKRTLLSIAIITLIIITFFILSYLLGWNEITSLNIHMP